MKNLVIIGAGAAGLMAAVSAGNVLKGSEYKITLVEKNNRPARKVMITGKGRCNVTNNCDVPSLISNTPKNGKFLYSAFSAFSSFDTINFFESHGVPLKTERGNRVFPVSDKAVDIVDALVKEAGRNCEIVTASAEKIITDNGRVSAVVLDNGNKILCDKVIIATGGFSYPLTGSTGDGHCMAKEIGHTVTDIKPSLVPLECHEGFCSKLSGLSLKNVTFSVYEEGKKKEVFSELGEMLFTHFGISGPLVLSASSHIRDIDKKNYYALIDLKPALDKQQLDKRLLRDFSEVPNKDFSNSLDKLLPKSLISTVVALSKIPADTKVNQISKEERTQLIEVIKGLKLHIIGFRPIDEAIITDGGISVKEIDPTTLSSKIVDGLYFAGEIIDVSAYTGGFNLQIAFSTGFVAGKSAAEKMKES